MPVWKCSKCGTTVEGRCRPPKCPKCGAPKEEFKKECSYLFSGDDHSSLLHSYEEESFI